MNLLTSDPKSHPSQRSYGGPLPSSSTTMEIEAGRRIGPFSIGMDIGAALVSLPVQLS